MRITGRVAWRAPLTVVVVLGMSLLGSNLAVAASPGPGWTISSVAEPADFSSEHNVACEAAPNQVPPGGSPCDSYRVIARNVGSLPSSEPVALSVTLPPATGVQAVFALLEVSQGGGKTSRVNCSLSPIRCEYAPAVAPGGVLIVTVNVTVSPSAGSRALNSASIEGGGLAHPLATSEPTTEPNPVNDSTPAFAIEGFDFRVDGPDGALDPDAGGHPYGVTTSFHIPSLTRIAPSEAVRIYVHAPVQRIKDVAAELPAGVVGDTQAAARCPLSAIMENYVGPTTPTNCPAASRVGTATIEGEGAFHTSGSLNSGTSSIFNMVPESGYPAEFGLSYLGKPVIMYASLLPASSGYALRVSVGGLLALPLEGISLTFFGDPALQDGLGNSSPAFLRNPTDCAPGPLQAKIEADSWEEPTRWVSQESTAYPQVVGCNALQFDPAIAVTPTETTQADAPSGYEVDLKVPQGAGLSPELATPDLKDAEVSLPEGVSVSPGAAAGLVGCMESGPEGINLTHGWTPTGAEPLDPADPDAIEIGSNGLPRVAPGHCPAASQIGTVEIITPLLASPLQGHVYVAQPHCGGEGQPPCTSASAANGELFGLYLEVAGSGVIVKLKGTVSVDPTTGRITTSFAENPQLPFSELKLQLKGGARAPLANPQSCGEAQTTSILEPWSSPDSGSPATPFSSFPVTGCASPMPFTPAFSAGTLGASAGAFSPFTLTFSRSDGQQDLSGLTVQTPPGLLGMLSSVQLCPEPEASQGACEQQSEIGHTEVAAGAGPAPYWEPGSVFLTGPYKGQPFGLSIVTHAQAGPFNLGNVIVRAAIHVDPHTSVLTVTSDPLPQIVDGVPLRIQTVNVNIDRPGFMFNPTNCEQLHVGGTIAGALPNGSAGSSVSVSSPFAVAGCASLPFAAKLTASTQGQTSKSNGAGLVVKVTSSPGQANIAKTSLILPIALPSRLTTIQKACVDSVFEADPAACDEGSDIGTATVHTPVLKNPLTGPAYLVSHGGAAFPDVEFVLQGEGITLVLDGQTNIRKGVTSSSFNAVPDAPVTSFETILPEGPHSALTANVAPSKKFSLCGAKLVMPTTITGQNGAVIKQETKIAVQGCGAVKSNKAKKLSRAQRLKKALKACRKKRDKSKRPSCEAKARKQFGPKKTKRKPAKKTH